MKFDELVTTLAARPLNGEFPGGYRVPEVTLAQLRLIVDVRFVRRNPSLLIVRMALDDGLANLIARPDLQDRLQDAWLFLTDR
jgi:hypothetical protein